MTEQETMNRCAHVWLMSRNVIVDFLRQLNPNAPIETHEHNAAAIIARLAHNDPPLMICTQDEMKE